MEIINIIILTINTISVVCILVIFTATVVEKGVPEVSKVATSTKTTNVSYFILVLIKLLPSN